MRGSKVSYASDTKNFKAKISLAELDMDTFKVMWNLSAPGGGAEGCFMRLDQKEYYRAEYTQPNPLEVMPDVSSPLSFS